MDLRQLPGMTYKVAENFSHLPMDRTSPFAVPGLSGTLNVSYAGKKLSASVSDLEVTVPNVEGPVTVQFPPGASVRCICSADAVRVLRRTVDPAAVADVEPDEEPSDAVPTPAH